MANQKSMRQVRQKQLAVWAPYAVFGVIIIILPPFVSLYMQSIIVKVLIFAIFAMSLNLLWGLTGLISLGHAAYFGVAGYTVGILITHYGIESFWITAPAGILLAGLIAAVFGIVALRVSGVYFLMVTWALGELLYNVAMKWRTLTYGENGLAGIPLPDLGLPWFTMNMTTFYYMVFIACIICLFLMYRFIRSPLGVALQGIREGELRMRVLGYNTWLYKYLAFIIGGLFAGVAGVLFVHYSGIIAPLHLGSATSILVVLMVLLGSDKTAFGPVLGAGLVVGISQVASIYTPERWPLILGGIFIIAMMLLRGGIGIHLSKLWRRAFYGSIKG